MFEDDTFAERKTFRFLLHIFLNVASLSVTSSGRDINYKGAFNAIKSGFMERSFPVALSGGVITCNTTFSSLLLSFLIS